MSISITEVKSSVSFRNLVEWRNLSKQRLFQVKHDVVSETLLLIHTSSESLAKHEAV